MLSSLLSLSPGAVPQHKSSSQAPDVVLYAWKVPCEGCSEIIKSKEVGRRQRRWLSARAASWARNWWVLPPSGRAVTQLTQCAWKVLRASNVFICCCFRLILKWIHFFLMNLPTAPPTVLQAVLVDGGGSSPDWVHLGPETIKPGPSTLFLPSTDGLYSDFVVFWFVLWFVFTLV